MLMSGDATISLGIEATAALTREDRVTERLPTLAAARSAFLTDFLLEGGSLTTHKTYRSLLRSFEHDDRSILALTPEGCRRLIADKMGASAYSTARTYAAVLQSFGSYLKRYGVPNPMQDVPKPRARPLPHRFLSKADLLKLWRACPDDQYRVLLLLLMEGLRASEARLLKWRDVDGDTALVLGKGGRYRRIVLSGPLCLILTRLRADHVGEYVLGYSYNALRQRSRRLARLAGVPMTAHLLRHTWASSALMAGMDSESIKVLGGWSGNSQAFQRYIQSAREHAALDRAREFSLTERLLSD